MSKKLLSTVPIPTTAPAPLRVETDGLYNVPTSPASNLMFETIAAGDSIKLLPERKQRTSHTKTSMTVSESKDGTRSNVSIDTPTANITIGITDIDKLAGSNKAAKKLFVLALIKANEQAIRGGVLARDHVSFPLQELVDMGFYSSLRSARTGFNSGADVLTSIKIKGTIRKSKNHSVSVDALEVPFTGAHIKKGQCFIFLNDRLNWDFIAQYFTVIPRYYFRLPNKASDLLYYVFYLARQRTKEIADKGYFDISCRALQARLNLPDEKATLNPSRDIKGAISAAVDEIEKEHSASHHNTDLSFLPMWDDEAPIADFLDRGYLRVFLKGPFAVPFMNISATAQKQIDAAQKRREKATERGIAAAIEKKMLAEGATESAEN